jgi:glycosyltransferase involved in cell wall biosynthesis
VKVLFYTRNDCLTNIGGDTIQILKIKECLEKSGVKIDFGTHSKLQTRNYDIIHVFNVIPINPVYNFIKSHKDAKIVLSPIYWNLSEYKRKVLDKVIIKRKTYNFLKGIPFLKRVVDSKLISLISGINTNGMFFEKLRFCMNTAELLMPNSIAEHNNLEIEFNINNKIRIIPNGVDINIQPESFLSLKKKYNLPPDFILCVGRIEYRKNQVKLLKAAAKIGIKVVLVGKVSQQEKKYYNRLKDYNFIHLPVLSQSELFGLYSGCKAHVLPSWFETPGLVSLEAAYHGAQIVTTDRGCTKEYFRDYAYYCDPEKTESIERAILDSLNEPKEMKNFKDIINNNYTWEIAAQKTLMAYESIL